MSNIDIWFPFYYGDYLKDTMQLTAERHGIYLLLMIHCWQNESIEDDIDSIAMIAKVQPDNKSLTYILEKYFVKKDGKYFQNRITKELKCARENKEKNHERAKRAAEARWSNDATSNATSMLQASDKQCLSNATDHAKTMLEQCPSPSPSSSHTNTPTESPKPKKKKGRFTPDYSFIVSDEWKSIFQEWVENKKNPYNKQIGVEKGYTELINLSNNDKVMAQAIIDRSLANNWSGLFPVKEHGKPDNHKRGGINFEL